MNARSPRTRIALATSLALASVIAPAPARGGPTVIRDEMLRDTAITPVLGRGYSIATNTYQSICLKDLTKTKPSYNFNYVFQEIQEDGSVAKSSQSTSAASSYYYKTFGFGVAVGATKTNSRTDDKTQTTWHKHSMMVTILIDVYYSSVDESASKLSPSAATLLTNKDIPGFFDACGMYYVRSISRQAALMSTFTYETKSSKRDYDFEMQIKVMVGAFTPIAGGAVELGVGLGESLHESFSSSNLTIKTIGMGIGKDESVMLVSYDLATFKDAIKGAFKATQPEDVGMVTAIEVVPWVENTEFQNLNKLEPIMVPVLGPDGVQETEPQLDPAIPPKKKFKRVMPYAQKRILTQNSEFLAETDRAARAKLNVYYKAKACKARIELDNMIQLQAGKWSFREMTNPPEDNPDADLGDNIVINNRTGGNPIKISELYYGNLTQKTLELMWMEYDSFIYGGGGDDVPDADTNPVKRAEIALQYLTGKGKGAYPRNVFPGGSRCLDDLVNAGITSVSYRKIKTCERLEEQFITVMGKRIDDYCMPSYGPPPKKAGFAGGNTGGMNLDPSQSKEAPLSPKEKFEADEKEKERAAAEKDKNNPNLTPEQRQDNANARQRDTDKRRKESNEANGGI